VEKILELKIPPVAVLLVVAILMWLCEKTFPFLTVNFNFKLVVTAIIAVSGCSIVIAGARTFHRAGTTVNPLRPEATTTLVTEGVYRFSRHPIYLGLAMILLSWGIYLANLLSILLVIAFVVYINHFQIQPEERMLQKLFGICFERYKQQVRRWL
jgi:protein-S-isoprenylcysteine O-methyltransferase Ste14